MPDYDTQIHKFLTDQLSVWPLAAANFRYLKSAQSRTLSVHGLEVVAQFNPCRIASSTAEVDDASIAARPCFLCVDKRPAEQQHLKFEGRKGRKYNIQVNPYPIFPGHLVICRDCHTPQSIWRCIVDMLDMARKIRGYTIFYNGPHSGASAPDHMHFQAVPRSMMPLERAIDAALDCAVTSSNAVEPQDRPNAHPENRDLTYLTSVQDAELYHYRHYANGIFALKSRTVKSMAKLFYRLLDCVPMYPGEDEPRINLYAWSTDSGQLRVVVVMRTEARSRHYAASGPGHLTMSPGCADIAGVFVCPKQEDYDKLSDRLLEEMVSDVCITPETESNIIWRLTRSQRSIDVGILAAKEIRFEVISDGAGPQKVSYEDGRINYNGTLYDELFFDAVTPSSLFAEPSFILYGVRIGIGFHWERRQDQKFAGSLRFVVEGEQVRAINRVGIEDYLVSVISSEMRPSASLEFLKAHAVISRSWVISQLANGHNHTGHAAQPAAEHNRTDQIAAEPAHTEDTAGLHVRTPQRLITWFDHEDHTLFDVCADDHCQRYQGLTGAIGQTARKAVDDTWGEVLTYEGEICDARFSKCCGGTTERFSTCWDDVDYPYLRVRQDEFCSEADPQTLKQVLNDYDLETRDFYSWEVRYSRAELSELFARRSGFNVGEIQDLVPVERGESGRIKVLRVVGRDRTVEIGKELIIRRYLSETHLKSAAFDVEQDGDTFILRGRGWGHGVGLCQIGAAVMSTKGYDYRQILTYYYPDTQIERR